MTVLNKLATAQNRQDEAVNQALAQEIVRGNDGRAVRELVDGLSNKDKNIQSDCIKVLGRPRMVGSGPQKLDSQEGRI